MARKTRLWIGKEFKSISMKRIGFILLLVVLVKLDGFAQSVSRQITYINISRPNGGSVSSGDTLEIRAVISVESGITIYNVLFNGAVPINTVYIPGTLAAKTNEGATSATNTGNYTDASGDDRAQYSAGAVVMNLGGSAGNPPAAGGDIQGGTTVPRFYSSSTIIQATFRVRVTGANGTQIVTAGNSFSYGTKNNGPLAAYPLSDLGILVGPQYACSALDPYNMISDELGGSYTAGTAQDRISSPIVNGFTYTTITSNSPNDGFYSVVKNSSYTQTTNTSAPNSDRVFSVWGIFGDHTGTNNGAGNPPAAAGQNGGYMLIVNASYVPGSVFTTNVTGLITNSTYTFSVWIRNLCGSCSGSPNGGGGSGAGVLPNLLISINGLDYYGSGDIPANNQWVQKTFTFTTGNWTSAAITVRNNAPGGGGNDWAVDDFTMNQCLILLPVTFIDINAYHQSGTSQITWSTTKDETVDKYIIEYSNDGKAFYTAGEVKATGNGGRYNFSENRQVNNKMYYRIMQLDKNARAQYSKVLIVRDQSNKESLLKLSPNPAISNPTISLWSDAKQTVRIKLMDASGKLVSLTSKQMNRGANSFALNTPFQLTPGLYMVQVVFENGNMATERLMISQR